VQRMLLNYGFFQVGWFACVWGAASGRPWLGPLVVLVAVAVHLAVAVNPRRELLLLGICALIGLVFDTVLLQTGWVSYPNGIWLTGFAPYWMIALWVLFGTTLNLSMKWLRGRIWLAFLFGLIGGPASYLAGQALGGMTLIESVPALIALAVGWGLVMPILFWLAERMDGFSSATRPDFILASWHKQEV